MSAEPDQRATVKAQSAFVLGGADCLEEDLEKVRRLCQPDLIIACNHAGIVTPHVDHWGSLHPALFPMWIEARRKIGHAPVHNYWTSDTKELVPGVKLRCIKGWGGSSGLFAVQIALNLGCFPIICCGVPLLPQFAHFDDKRRWNEASNYRSAWTKHKTQLDGKVKSMSGWTQELLGAPTREWLHADDGTAFGEFGEGSEEPAP